MNTIRTLLVDDTVIYRKILAEVVSKFPYIENAGTAASGSIALRKMAQSPVDLVLLDLHMPDMDGVETLKLIRQKHPQTLVVIISGINSRSARTTIAALELGAVDFVRKPEGNDFQANIERMVNDLTPVFRLVQSRIRSTHPSVKQTGRVKASPPADSSAAMVKNPAVPDLFSVVVIGVSTGGPEALKKLIPLLPASLPVPVLLVQHMPPTFTRSLAESLNRKSSLQVMEAEEQQVVKPGCVYIAPGGKHMVVREKNGTVYIGLNDGPPENSCRPSVDVLFRSVASVYGGRGILAAVLTGMGSDGLNGVRTLKRKGCLCLTQDEKSCVVYGMPRAVDEAGLSDKSLSLEHIAKEMCMKLRCSPL
ncbi:MAG: protein-glutamate methylesterase/protein-glutamine glutaminase [Chitinivibrionales bacterium]